MSEWARNLDTYNDRFEDDSIWTTIKWSKPLQYLVYNYDITEEGMADFLDYTEANEQEVSRLDLEHLSDLYIEFRNSQSADQH